MTNEICTQVAEPGLIAFGEVVIGDWFVDQFDGCDTWEKTSAHQAKVVRAQFFGPNSGGEGTVHEIDPTWPVLPKQKPRSEAQGV